MTPPTAQVSLSVFSSTGRLVIRAGDVEPGAHGPVGAGTHGVGVPIAAAVSVAQTPNGGTFTFGATSMMVAASRLLTLHFTWLVTASADGAAPQVHMNLAP